MAYHLYVTKAIVVRKTPVGEASAYVGLFTKDLGYIRAHAQGLFLPSSKLRYGLEPYSIGLVSLVRGKEKWRVVNIIPETNYYYLFKREPKKLQVVKNILRLLEKLLAGEEENRELFELVTEAFGFLNRSEHDFDVELLLVLRVLRNLGYIESVPVLESFAASRLWNGEVVLGAKRQFSEILRVVNQAIAESQF